MLRIATALFTLALVGCASDPEPPPELDPTAPDTLGPYAVGHESFTTVDAARGDRSLLVDVWYPSDPESAGMFRAAEYPLAPLIALESAVAMRGAPVTTRPRRPLVIFSHGYGAIHTQSAELCEALASHGFVVAAVEHTGNAQSSLTDTFDEAASRRVPDVSFVIDHMLARAADPEDIFFERVDETRIGVVGHSFGGMTSIGAAAGWGGAAPDPRVTAIVPISAVIDGDLQEDTRMGPNAGFTSAQMAAVIIPAMLVGGTEDTNVPIGNNQLAFDQMSNAPAVYKVDVLGATHTHFSNVCAIGDLLIDDLALPQDMWETLGAGDLIEPYNQTCTPDVFSIDESNRLQNLYVVAFFGAHLLAQPFYETWLTPAHADTEPFATLARRP